MVGLCPSGKQIKKGCAWDRFHEWLDFLGLNIIAFTNLSCDPDCDFKKDSIDLNHLKEVVDHFDKVIAWGSTVSKFLNKIDVDHFVLPHPSPRNRQMNDKEFVNRKLKECKEYIYDENCSR